MVTKLLQLPIFREDVRVYMQGYARRVSRKDHETSTHVK